MSYPFSFIAHKTKGLLRPRLLSEHSHAIIMIENNVRDDNFIRYRHDKHFLKVTVVPKKDFFSISKDNFTLSIDDVHKEDDLPEWWQSKLDRWENKALSAVNNWMQQGKITAGNAASQKTLEKILGISR